MAVASFLRDMGQADAVQVKADSFAANKICKRTGIGWVRHLDTCVLWVQHAVRRCALQVHAALGEQNPAGVMTKYAGHEVLMAHRCAIGVVASRRPSRGCAPMRAMWRSVVPESGQGSLAPRRGSSIQRVALGAGVL